MTDNSYMIEYAKSSRSKCKKCKQVIEKDDLRIVSVIPGEQFEMKVNHHVGCFALPRKLTTGAQQKTPGDFVDDMLQDESGDILPAKRDEIVQAIEGASAKGTKRAGPASAKKGGGSSDGDLLSELKQAYEAGEDDEQPPAKRSKKGAKKEDNDEKKKMVEAYGFYHKHKVDDIKDVLRWNRQVLMGSKPFLLIKAIDGHVRGRLARCALCGGRLKLLEDGVSVQCSGSFDEDTQRRIDCGFKTTATEAPRWQPWYSVEPSEDEKVEMDKLEAEAKGEETSADAAAAGASDEMNGLQKAVAKLDWQLTSKQGLRTATQEIVKILREHNVDVPEEDAKAQQRVGPILAANRTKSAQETIPILVQEFGYAAAKEKKAAKKMAAVETMVKNPKNAGIVKAFQELSELYFKEGNRNAGSSYMKVVSALQDLPIEVTEDNAMGLSKGKTKVAGIGKASAEKILEFCQSGTIQKLEEKRADAA